MGNPFSKIDGEFELLWHDTEQVGMDAWDLLKLPVEVLYNDYKILQWAWNHKLLGLTATLGGAAWGAVVLQRMPGDVAYVGPIIGAVSGAWGMFYLSSTLAGQPPEEWQIVYRAPGQVSPIIVNLTNAIEFIAWVGTRPWESNTSFLAGATLGWLLLPDFPMSLPAILGGLGGVALAYNLSVSGAPPITNPQTPPNIAGSP